MNKLFLILAVLATSRFWLTDHEVIASLSGLVGVVVIWSGWAMESIAETEHNFAGPPRSSLERI